MRVVVVVAVVVVTCAALGACAGYRFPTGPSTGTGTVSGQVLAVPCAPVEQAGVQCKGRPVPNLDIVFTSSSGAELVTARTDETGNYSVDLAAGTWSVALKGYTRLLSGPKTVTVAAGGTVVANFVVASGIVVPLPQPAPAA